MIRHVIIFFLISMIESEDCDFGINQLNEIRQIFNDSERRMEAATRGQSGRSAFVIGNGRNGKSTLINYLMGNLLKAYRSGKYEPLKLELANSNTKGPEIGAGSLSVTTIPKKWNSTRPQLQNLDIWDTAGFTDNRGIMQDLNNSFHLYHLTRKVETLKFIIVISFSDIINDNVEQMRKLLSTLEEYFTDSFRTFFPSISVIISKAPKSDDFDNLVDHEYITDKLFNRLLSNPNMSISEVSKDFVRHIIIHKNQILAFFKKAQQTGIVTSEIDVNIIPAINNCKRIIKSCLQNVGLTISQESEFCLRKANDELLSIDAILEFQTELCNSFDEKFAASCQSNDTNTLQTNKADLNRINESLKTSLDNNSDAEVKIQTLEIISDNLKKFITAEKLLNKVSLIKFLDSILKTKGMSYIATSVNGLVNAVKAKIRSLLTTCSHKLNEITENERKKKEAEDVENSKRVLNNTENDVSKLVIREERKSGWRIFLEGLARFLQLDGSAMTMG
ncbi:uncharacterized protein LOC122508737 [Leptopilina heterotoma]|uniref:uncharacterized protein LOC122508737 n=1 Tax=Leptopilina heterotoma TaxID=63436 RepID=UPI001CA7E540|nr:uncharacterized protein LOC122508737 [Leptopilina heterotoma]